jgi:hypothetical protein
LEIKIRFILKNLRPHRIPRFRIGCGPTLCGSRAAGRPLAPARDPAMGGAAWCCEGWCVAWKRSGGPHRIRADRLLSHLRVVPRAQNDPLRFRWWPKVFDGMPLRATAACHDLSGGEVSLRLGDWSPHDSLTGLPWGCWLEGARTKGDGRRCEVGAGVGAATATWRRCWRLLPVWERANVCATTCGGSARAR